MYLISTSCKITIAFNSKINLVRNVVRSIRILEAYPSQVQSLSKSELSVCLFTGIYSASLQRVLQRQNGPVALVRWHWCER